MPGIIQHVPGTNVCACQPATNSHHVMPPHSTSDSYPASDEFIYCCYTRTLPDMDLLFMTAKQHFSLYTKYTIKCCSRCTYPLSHPDGASLACQPTTNPPPPDTTSRHHTRRLPRPLRLLCTPPAFGVGTVSSAPSRKGCVVNGQTTEASNK